jgi:uncharacterized Fe-S center protein
MAITGSLASLSNNVNFLSSATQQAIVKPEDFKGIAGFVFDVITLDSIELSSDITDHYIEDNTAINDHIALKPEIIRVEGLVGELKYEIPAELRQLKRSFGKTNCFRWIFARTYKHKRTKFTIRLKLI